MTLRSEPKRYWLPRKERAISEIKPDLRQTIRALCLGESRWPLFLCSPAGCGKTCAALCLLDHAGGIYYSTQSLCQVLIDANQGRLTTTSGRPVFAENLWAEWAEAPLFVLDELGGRERVSDHHYEAVKRVLDERESKPLVCLSNLDTPALVRLYDDRIVSRLCSGTIVRLSGADRRLQKSPPRRETARESAGDEKSR